MGAMNLVRYIMGILVPAAAVVAMLTGTAAAQMGPLTPKLSLQGEEKHLTPEEIEKRKQLDDAYKAATNKIPDQKANDPWADVRPAPSTPVPKKKQQ
jgi:hypothetical protein